MRMIRVQDQSVHDRHHDQNTTVGKTVITGLHHVPGRVDLNVVSNHEARLVHIVVDVPTDGTKPRGAVKAPEIRLSLSGASPEAGLRYVAFIATRLAIFLAIVDCY